MLGTLALGASTELLSRRSWVVLRHYSGQLWSQIAVAAMLRVMPNSWFSYGFTVLDRSGTPIARPNSSNWPETAKIAVGGTHCEAHRKGMGKEFFLEGGNGWVVTVARSRAARGIASYSSGAAANTNRPKGVNVGRELGRVNSKAGPRRDPPPAG